MGFLGQAALHRASLARVQQRLGDPAAADSFERAIGDALSVGDGRLASTARLNLARLLRGAGDREAAVRLLEENERWYRSAGGGDFALATQCALGAVRDDGSGIEQVLEEARSAGNVEVQVYALDALGRLAAESGDLDRAGSLLDDSDALAAQVAHLVDESDRYDAQLARRRTTGQAVATPGVGTIT